jgi:hypothetical protein
MLPSRFDIPSLETAVSNVSESNILGAIEQYSFQLEQSIQKRDVEKMILAGGVLVTLLRRNSDWLNDQVVDGTVARLTAKSAN